MGAVDEAVEDGVGDGGIVEPGMPVVDGQLAGDDGGFAGAVVDDFQEVVARGLVERGHGPVVEDEHVDACELRQGAAEAAVGVGDAQHFGEARYA